MGKFVNLGHALSSNAAHDDIALVDLLRSDRPRTVTYGEFDRLCRSVARGLRRLGLKQGDSVAILSANRTEYLATLFGAMRAGMVGVPVNFKLPAATVAAVLRDSGAKVLFCDTPRRGQCPDDITTVNFDQTEGAEGFEALLDHGPFDTVTPLPRTPAMIVYTSGSTGQPKGVLFGHDGHLWAIEARARGEPLRRDRAIVAAPLYHMNGMAMCQSMMANGGTVVLLPGFVAVDFIAAVAAHRPTILPAVPTMIALMLREKEAMARADLSSVKAIRLSSAPLSQTLLDQSREAFPGAVVTNGYGTTEGGPFVFAIPPSSQPLPDLAVGCLNPEVSIRLKRGGKVVLDEGVLEVKSPATMLGYHNLPDATRRVLTEDGHYITGDVFRCDGAGFFYFASRADDMFVCGGENIYPSEVEQMLASHPGIHQVCVVAVADHVKGHKPVAFVVTKASAVVSEQGIKDYALAKAPPYQHPRRVWFLPEMPLAGTNVKSRAIVTP